ncbi:hypothetical protein MTO96_017345 [Rhipicephalus appendiculatus]
MAAAFGEVNETPLMFSRSSSLGSLSSLDRQAALNAHNLAVNQSQHTSGAVSPSDLPDSPSQTMPPSPRHRSPEPVFRLPPCRKPIPQPIGGVFQDCPRSFAEEGTPCRMSQATSLSSLTQDDDASNIEKMLRHDDEHEAFQESSFEEEREDHAHFVDDAYYERKHLQGRSHMPSHGVASIDEAWIKQNPPCQDSSDEEDDARLLQEVVMMGRALAGNPDLSVGMASPSTQSPKVPPQSDMQSPPSSTPSISVASPLRPHQYAQDTRHGVAPTLMSVEDNPVKVPLVSPSHVCSKPEASNFLDDGMHLSESSDEEQDSKILLEVISLGRAAVGKQQHSGGKSTNSNTKCLRKNVSGIQHESSSVLAGDSSCMTMQPAVSDPPPPNQYPASPRAVPDVNDCLIHDDDDDDGKLLKEVIMLGLSSVQSIALNLPAPHIGKQPITVPEKEMPTIATPRGDSDKETSALKDSPPVPIKAPVCDSAHKDTHSMEGEQKDKLAVPPEPPADSSDRVVQIRLKLPNGRSLTRRFLASAELGVLLVFLDSLGYPLTRFKILKNWRRQELATINPKQTLEQLKLYPKKTLTIKER